VQPVEGNSPLLLSDPQNVWLVRTDRVEVFGVPLKDGQPAGARIHLSSFEPGQLLFGAAAGPWGLVAVGRPGSTAVCLPQSRFEQWAAEQPSGSPLPTLVETWVEHLTAGIARGTISEERAFD